MDGHFTETHDYRSPCARAGLAAPRWSSLVVQKIYRVAGGPSLRIVAFLSLGCEIAVAALNPAEDYFAFRGTAMRFAFALAAMMLASGANAQAPAPAQPPKLPTRPAAVSAPPSSYCLPASAAFLEGDSKAAEEMRKCARGDTVVIPARNPGAVARVCDFSKSMVAIGDNVVCVMVSPERGSK